MNISCPTTRWYSLLFMATFLKLIVSCLGNTKQSKIEGKHPLNDPAHEIHNIISNTESKQLGFWDMRSPDFTWVTLVVLLTQTQATCLFKSAAGEQMRWKRFLYSLCSTTTARATLFRETTNRCIVLSLLVSVLSLPPQCLTLPICRSRTEQTCWGKL